MANSPEPSQTVDGVGTFLVVSADAFIVEHVVVADVGEVLWVDKKKMPLQTITMFIVFG